ncbi:hypothetical protein BH11PSE2_BH11PSE2_12970 [soil metagenome]
MKRLILALAALATVAAPMAAATSADAQGRDRGDRYDRNDNGRHNGWNNSRNNRGDDRRDNRRDNRRDDRWDSRRHNGYSYNNRWYYGAPPVAYYGQSGFYPGYQAWSRGSYLPRSYWGGNYVVYDYGRYRLRQPPRGYHWVNVNGDFLLAALATGLIAEVILNNR